MVLTKNLMSDAFDPFAPEDTSHSLSRKAMTERNEKQSGFQETRSATLNLFSDFENYLEPHEYTTLNSDNNHLILQQRLNLRNQYLGELSSVSMSHPSLDRSHAFRPIDSASSHALHLFQNDSMLSSTETKAVEMPQNHVEPTTIYIDLHEQLSTRYENNDTRVSSRVEGSIHARSSSGAPFTLFINDRNRQIKSFHEDPSFCMRRSKLEVGRASDCDVPFEPGPAAISEQTTLTVVLPVNTAKKQRILSYACNTKVRPVPFLVKSKVLVEGDRCRVGAKVRSNPSNQQSTKITVLMAVPPEIRGESLKLTGKDGVWDEMKRVVVWPAEDLDPGEMLEIQAHFTMVNPYQGIDGALPSFPIIVRCEGENYQFSDVQVTTDEFDEIHAPVKLLLTRSVVILYRRG